MISITNCYIRVYVFMLVSHPSAEKIRSSRLLNTAVIDSQCNHEKLSEIIKSFVWVKRAACEYRVTFILSIFYALFCI